jgi:kynureninase
VTQFAIECFKDLDHQKVNILIPEKVEERGCQISIKVRQGDKKLFHYLEKNDVIADWREPDVIRIAPVPLYNTYSEIFRFSQILQSGLLTL